MVRILLIVAGFILLFTQQFIGFISAQTQFIIFLVGIVALGVPHGAADLLVANQKASMEAKAFSKINFLSSYILRLVLFAFILWFFPLAGNLLFIVFAAYHFGETDLYKFQTDTIAGKLFIISYGLLILGVILLHNFQDLLPLFQQFKSGIQNASFINWVNTYRYSILSFLGFFFFASTFFYFLTNKNSYLKGDFLLQLALLLFILYHLPMLLGFTFYFVVWHSVLSIQKIISYLRQDKLFSSSVIIRQICFYSFLAMAGIVIFGFAGFMFVNANTIVIYVFLGLAVLTAPHMQIMHDMYRSIRATQVSST